MSPHLRSHHSRKAGLYLEMNQEACAPAAEVRYTVEQACLVYLVMLITVRFDDDQLIVVARNSTSTLKSSSPASWLKETREIVFYSLIHVIFLITAVSEVVCKKECYEHSNCRCLLWSAEISLMSDSWSRNWISANKISVFYSQRSALLLPLGFPVWKG